jgi:NADH-quinone oxidoreductase subunit H
MSTLVTQMQKVPRWGWLLVGLFVLGVVAIVTALNFNAINTAATSAGTAVGTFVFDRDSRTAGQEIIQCRTNSTCSITHAFIFSAVVLLIVITGFAYTTLLERKYIAWFQQRVGPNRVGPWGLMQPAADAVKLIFKEDITPSGANVPVYMLAPMLKVVPTLIVIAVIPWGPDIIVPWFDGRLYQVPLGLADPNVGILWLLGITSIATYGVALAGWSSNNKYAMLGGMRATAQMISYELTLGLAMAVPVLIVGSLSVGDIIHAQAATPFNWFVFQNPLAAGILIIALMAEVNRAPFDLPEAEQELTAGFMTEYSGMKFAMFMMAEYLGMIGVSMIAMSLFFGGYSLGFGIVENAPILGPLVIMGKIFLCLIGFVWVRATLPRIRYDRLMTFGWKVLLPLALVAVCWTAVSVAIGRAFEGSREFQQVYGIAAGVVLVAVVIFGYFALRQASKADANDQTRAQIDPMITGDQVSFSAVALQILGGIIAIPFGLYALFIGTLKAMRNAGEDPLKAAPAETSTAITPVGETKPTVK